MPQKMNALWRLVWLTVALFCTAFFVFYHTSMIGVAEKFEVGEIKILRAKLSIALRQRDSYMRSLQIQAWRLQSVREDRRNLSRQLNEVTKKFMQLRCSLEENVTSTGAWCEGPFAEKHFTDDGLIGFLTQILGGKTVGSFGEGPGEYKRLLLQSGLVKNYDAYDGSPWIENATSGRVQYLDLTVPQYGLPVYDWVISVEVAEHIPAEYEDVYLQNLVRHSRHGLILSWAVPMQSGYGHVNPRPSDYVDARLRTMCFEKDQATTNQLRRYAKLIWLKKNLKAFTRNVNCTAFTIDDA